MSWPLVQIGKYADKVRTWNPAAGEECIFQYVDLSSVDKSRKVIDLDNVAEISSAEAPSRARQLVVAGDVLVATVRPNLNGVAVVPAELNGATASTGYCVLRADEKNLHGRYLFHWVQTGSFVEDMMSKATGANYPAVSDKIVKESKIPLPPLPEQKRIAAILDKADAIRRKRQQAIQLADDFLRAVFLDMFGDPVTNPKGWTLKRFGEVGTWSSGGTPSRAVSDFFEGEINWYSAGELNSRYLDGSVEKISESAIKNSAAKIFKKGSLLVGMYDTAAMKISILKEDSSCNQACANVECNELASVEWLYSYIDYAKDSYLSRRRGVRQKNLNLGMIRDFLLPLPPRDLQDEFVRFVSAVFGIKKKQEEGKDFPVFESLSLKAFSGQL
ncbi:restriction endonuclease subunit S [Pseudomonas aeruginosa]|nr:restriction endonuclease subunit S [Pseudomonas aeruginosa]